MMTAAFYENILGNPLTSVTYITVIMLKKNIAVYPGSKKKFGFQRSLKNTPSRTQLREKKQIVHETL